MRFSTVLLRIVQRKEEIFRNYREYGRRLKEAFREVLGDGGVRVIIFGSVVRGNYSPLSDLDVLVVSRRAGEVRYGEAVERVEEKLGERLVGVEFHLVTPEVFEGWYRKFLDVYEEV
jgi:predicted nucleotidyltransferase